MVNIPYDKLFEGTSSEWVVIFGNDNSLKASQSLGFSAHWKICSFSRDIKPANIRLYRSFKIFLEDLNFKPVQKQIVQDNMSLAVYIKEIQAPPNDRLHTLTIKIFTSDNINEAAYNEFSKICLERRGYFSISHCRQIGLRIGRKRLHPMVLLNSPATALAIVSLCCHSYKNFLGEMEMFLREHKMPKEKLTFFGTSQDIEIGQANGALALLKQIFLGLLAGKSEITIIHECDEVYNPIMPSYDPLLHRRDPSRMVMDKDVQKTSVLMGWIMGKQIGDVTNMYSGKVLELEHHATS